jgi:hypothetical protein
VFFKAVLWAVSIPELTPITSSCFLFRIFTLFLSVMFRNLLRDYCSWNCNCFAGEESNS